LYAATIAKYGTVQLNGVVGIPSGKAAEYFQISLDATNKIINEGGYVLFNQYPDPA